MSKAPEFTAFQMLLAEVEAMPIPAMTKERFFALFRAMQGERVRVCRRDIISRDRLNTARTLLSAGVAQPLVKARLVSLYGISPRWAYAVIKRAKQDKAAKHG